MTTETYTPIRPEDIYHAFLQGRTEQNKEIPLVLYHKLPTHEKASWETLTNIINHTTKFHYPWPCDQNGTLEIRFDIMILYNLIATPMSPAEMITNNLQLSLYGVTRYQHDHPDTNGFIKIAELVTNHIQKWHPLPDPDQTPMEEDAPEA